MGRKKQKSEIPTQYLLDSLKESEDDHTVISFATGKDALDYLDKEIAKDKRAKHCIHPTIRKK